MNKIKIVTLAVVVCLFGTSLSAAPRPTKEDPKTVVLEEAWRAGRQMVENGLYLRGVRYLKAYLNQQPESPDGWYWLGKAYQGMGHLRKAQMAFTTTLEVDPHYTPLSRVLQNRATGEAVALWDPAGLKFSHGLPLIAPEKCPHIGHLPGKCVHRHNTKAYAAPLGYAPQPGVLTPPQNTSVVRPQPMPAPRAVPGVSPLGARKIVVQPGQKYNPTVPIPPVRNLTGEPEGPGIPTIQVPSLPSPNTPARPQPMTAPPAPMQQQYNPGVPAPSVRNIAGTPYVQGPSNLQGPAPNVPTGYQTMTAPPASMQQQYNPVVPIPPVCNLTGEPEGPGIPTIQVQSPTPNAPEAPQLSPTAPVYVPPAPQQKVSN